MPSYIASRVKLLLGEKINPIVLILGIGYKYDPLVSRWTKEKCLSLDEKFDAAIIITNQPGMDINQLLKNGVPILDCTNTYQNVDGIIQL